MLIFQGFWECLDIELVDLSAQRSVPHNRELVVGDLRLLGDFREQFYIQGRTGPIFVKKPAGKMEGLWRRLGGSPGAAILANISFA